MMAETSLPGAAAARRRSSAALLPARGLPLAYFAFAHASLAAACVVLILDPRMPGGFFYHPRMIAVVHLLTLGWIGGSILGAFYIVAPLALGTPMPARAIDGAACAMFGLGTSGMVAHFWLGTYDGMAWSALLVTGGVAIVGRAALRLPPATPWAVRLHVQLAFANFIAAAALGVVIGLDKSRGFLEVSPIAAAFAHAHLAAIGWPVMLVMGLAYRLIPMVLPATMPRGGSLVASAVLVEAGLAVLVPALLFGWSAAAAGAALVAAGLLVFVARMGGIARHRMPRPPALPARDWSVWQVRASFAWLVLSIALGAMLVAGPAGARATALAWVYGVAGLVGFLGQIIVGMQGRLVPMYAWYRAMAARDGAPPPFGAHDLVSPPHARAVFFLWSAGVPLLAWGLATGNPAVIRIAALLLGAGLAANGVYLTRVMRPT